MFKYVKIDENYKVIETAPTNKGSISNYNSVNNDAQLKLDGYSYEDVVFYIELGGEYVVGHEPEGLLEAKKQFKIEEMKLARDAEEQSFFIYDGKKFDSDTISSQRIGIAAQNALAAKLANKDFSISWTDYDNEEVLLDADGLINLSGALAAHSASVHSKYGEKKKEVEESTLDTIGGIVWT